MTRTGVPPTPKPLDQLLLIGRGRSPFQIEPRAVLTAAALFNDPDDPE